MHNEDPVVVINVLEYILALGIIFGTWIEYQAIIITKYDIYIYIIRRSFAT